MILTWGCGKKETVLARVGNRFDITLQDFKDSNFRFSKGVSYDEDLEKLNDHLNEMIDNKLLLLGAYDAGYDQDSTVLAHKVSSEKRFSMQQLYDKDVVNTIVTESEIRDYYAKLCKKITLRSIFLETDPSMDTVEIKLIRKKADGLVKKIQDGENYEFLASRYSDDRESGIKGGLLGTITYTRVGDPVQEAAFSMKEGEISGIIESKNGLNILKIDKVEPVPQKPYSEKRDEIKGALFRYHRNEIQQKADKYWNDLKTEKKVVLNDANIDSLAAIMKTWNTFITDSVLSGFKSLPDSIRNRDLVTYDGGHVAIPEFDAWIRMVMPDQIRNGIRSAQTIRQMMDNLLMSELLPELAKKQGLDKHPAVVRNVRQAYENTMLQLFIKNDIWGDISPTDEEVRQYYEDHLEDKYTPEKSYSMQEIVVDNEDLALDVMRRARQGQNFDALVEKFSIKPGKKRNHGMETFSQRRKPHHAEAADRMKRGDISDPVKLSENRWSVFKFLGVEQPPPRPFEQIRTQVRINLTNDIKNERKSKWLEEKRAQTAVVTHEDALKAYLDTFYEETGT